MKALGATVVLTPATERGSGTVRKAKELAERYLSTFLFEGITEDPDEALLG